MNKKTSGRLLKLVGVAVIMLAGQDAWAADQKLMDPTQSPMEAVAPGTAAAGMADPTALQLQSVMLSPKRKMAVISGQAYKLGDRVGDATLARISDHEAVLRNDDGSMQTLSMHAGIVKKMVTPPIEAGEVARKPKKNGKTAGKHNE